MQAHSWWVMEMAGKHSDHYFCRWQAKIVTTINIFFEKNEKNKKCLDRHVRRKISASVDGGPSSFFSCLSFRILKFSSSCDLDITMFLYWNVSVDWQFKSYAIMHLIASRCILAVTNKGLTSWLLNLKVTAVTQSQRQTHTFGQKNRNMILAVTVLIS